MSSAQGYAASLSAYSEKGKLNLRDEPDPPLAVLCKAKLLADKLRCGSHVVVHTGAGISTAAGISDFRGPDGVWTKAARGRELRTSSESSAVAADAAAAAATSFEDAEPTLTHMAIAALHAGGFVQHVVSQNVDGLHTRSGLPREALSELHGSLFVDWCAGCGVESRRDSAARTVGFRASGAECPECGGEMTDKALDWEDALPEADLEAARAHSAKADVAVVVGTSCQMEPARGLPFAKGKREVVMVNLSRTDYDERCAMTIRARSDELFAVVVRELGVDVGVYEREAEMVLRTEAVEGGTRCEMVGMWDGKEAKRLVRGVVGVRYRRQGGEWVKGEMARGYGGTVGHGPRGRIMAAVDVEGMGPTIVEAEEGKVSARVKVTTVRRTYDASGVAARVEEAAAQAQRKRKRAGRDEGQAVKQEDTRTWFARGKRRGWMVCAVCKKSVWSGRGKREQHLATCL